MKELNDEYRDHMKSINQKIQLETNHMREEEQKAA